jgi:hypothetical protein
MASVLWSILQQLLFYKLSMQGESFHKVGIKLWQSFNCTEADLLRYFQLITHCELDEDQIDSWHALNSKTDPNWDAAGIIRMLPKDYP